MAIRGEPGIGKTGLAREMLREARAKGFACHTSEVLDFGGSTGADPVRRLVLSLLGLALGADASERQAALTQVVETGRIAPKQESFLFDASIRDSMPPWNSA